jgi:hypothetical protein
VAAGKTPFGVAHLGRCAGAVCWGRTNSAAVPCAQVLDVARYCLHHMLAAYAMLQGGVSWAALKFEYAGATLTPNLILFAQGGRRMEGFGSAARKRGFSIPLVSGLTGWKRMVRAHCSPFALNPLGWACNSSIGQHLGPFVP